MARAQGARAQMALAFETTYGTPPVGGFTRMPFASATLGAEQPLLNSELLGYGRDPLAPIKDALTADGNVVVPIDAEAFGFWLKAAFGQPITTGTAAPYSHEFRSGSSPNAIASFNQMTGSIDALRDGDIATRVASTAAGQRMSFSLTGPTGPASVSAIAGVHLKQIAQAGTVGPDATAGFLRIGGVNHDATPETVPDLAPKPVYSSWAVNPVDASSWSDLTLPNEVGILSA